MLHYLHVYITIMVINIKLCFNILDVSVMDTAPCVIKKREPIVTAKTIPSLLTVIQIQRKKAMLSSAGNKR